MKLSRIFLAILIACLCVGTVFAASNFSQTAPAANVNGATANCTNLMSPTGNLDMNSSGSIFFMCSASLSAFVAKTKTITPTFALPSGYTGLYVYNSGDTLDETCQTMANTVHILSGTSHVFGTTPINWNYCATYTVTNQTSIGGFAVSWA